MGDLNRIRWRCRRGLLELDLILMHFLENHFDRLDAGQKELFNQLLDDFFHRAEAGNWGERDPRAGPAAPAPHPPAGNRDHYLFFAFGNVLSG